MSKVQILNKETISDKIYPLKYITFQKFTDEGVIDKQNEIYYRPDASAVLLYDAERQKFLLTKQFRIATYLNGNETGDLVEACAGLIDEGETPSQAAIREAEEELGYQIKNIKQVARVYTSGGGITELVHMFIAPYSPEMKKGEGGGMEEEGENITVFEMDFKEAKEQLQQGKIIDAKTILLMQHFFLFEHHI